MSRNHPPLIRRPRVYLALAAGLCALVLSGTVQTSQFVADKSVTHTTDPATPIGSGQALLDSQPFGALIGLPTGATLHDILDLSTGHPAAPVTASAAGGPGGQSSDGDTFTTSPVRTAGLMGGNSGTTVAASGDDSTMPLLLASATSFSGNPGGSHFAPATNNSGAGSTGSEPAADDATSGGARPAGGAGSGGNPIAGSNSDGRTASGTAPANDGNQDNDGAVADTTKPDSEVAETQPEAPTTLARVAKESGVPEDGLKSLIDPKTGGNATVTAPSVSGVNRVADVPEPNSALLFAAGLIALTMMFRRRRRYRG